MTEPGYIRPTPEERIAKLRACLPADPRQRSGYQADLAYLLHEIELRDAEIADLRQGVAVP